MKIVHGTWIPHTKTDFIQSGSFYLWIETPVPKSSRNHKQQIHPGHLAKGELINFLVQELGIKEPALQLSQRISTKYFALPTADNQPLPSPELIKYLEIEIPEEYTEFQYWQVDCYQTLTSVKNNTPAINIIRLLNDIHFLAINNLSEIQLGSDLLFWYHYTQSFKQIILKDQYIPTLKYRQLETPPPKGKSKKPISPAFEIYAGWSIISEQYEENIQKYIEYMPLICVAGAMKEGTGDWGLGTGEDGENNRYPMTNVQSSIKSLFGKDFETNLLLNLGYAARMYPQLWQGLETDTPVGMQLTLEEAFAFLQESAWVLEDAGFKVTVPAWYTPAGRRRAKLRLKASGKSRSATKGENKSYFGLNSLVQYEYELAIGEQAVTKQEWEQLINAKAPLVHFRGQWMELDRDKMQQLLEFWQSHGEEKPEMSVLEFLQRNAESGEDWDIEHDEILSDMMAKLQDKSSLEPISDQLNLQGNLREYQKRGVAWLEYLERLGLNGCLADDMGLGKSVQVIARLVQERELFSSEEEIGRWGDEEDEGDGENKGNKREKRNRGDGQTRLSNVPPTLLIAPTSVVGNWQKEIAKFAPHLQSMIHHGSDRLQNLADFKTACQQHDVIITSFTLARKDEKLLHSVKWQRIVLDEAQNIKNPKAAQTKAILKLSAKHRLALTGTPVENRLLDLWSIFNFLNPGYLGKEAQFRKSFEIPIQKDNDRIKSSTLKKLVEPLILRRVKTDKSIINDLPDKVEQKLYTNLTKEQASLYEVVVKDVEEKLQTVEGIQRKGLILSTLMKLKQICNHPAQFLQDNSEFSTERSHKLSRLVEMVDEAVSEGESLLIFSQFTEVCEQVEKYIKHNLRCNTYYLHGGTSRPRREKMITEFQEPDTEASVFILSLKAGGVGITLTKANHVFHFDRWWNPAVENQATDRAFRIGQQKNVFVHKFVAIGTLEEKIDQMIEDKKKLANAVVGNDESWLTELDNDAFKQLIALNKSAILE